MKTTFTLRTGLLLAFIMALTNMVAQTTGDYRTTAAVTSMSSKTGWETFDGTNWVAATYAPVGSTVGTQALIQNGNTSSSTSITLTAANPLIRVNQIVTGSGVPVGTFVTDIAGTALTLSQATTSTVSNTPLSFVEQFTVASCGTTNGSANVTFPANAAIVAGMGVTGNGIPNGTIVNTVNSTTSLTLSSNATASASVPLTFFTKETTATTTAGGTTITLKAPNSLITVGMNVYAATNNLFPYGATVTAISGSNITLSLPVPVAYPNGVAVVFATLGTIPNLYINHNTSTANNSKSFNIGNIFVNNATSNNAGTGATYTDATLFVGGTSTSFNIFACKTLTVASGAKVNVASPSNAGTFINHLALNGGEGGNALINNGTIDLVTSPAVFAGNTVKTNIYFTTNGSTTITGTGTFAYNNFSVNKGSVVINTNSTITGGTIATGTTLTVNEGKVLNNSGVFTNTGDLILKSSATGTASLLSTATVNNVTQQRYLSSNQRGWRLLGNPLATTTFGTLASDSTTPFTLGTGASGAYDSATNTWTSGTDADNMASQQAYKVFVRGRTSEVTGTSYSVSPPSNVTVSIKGAAANTAPTQVATTAGQYYLVANPYTAPVSVYSILGASTGLSTTVSYYNPTIASSGSNADLILKYGGYANPTITAAAQGDANDVVLPPMGAIFVQASSSGTINVPKTSIFTGPVLGGSYNQKTAQTKVASTNALKIEVNSNGTYYDALALQFKAVGDADSNIDFGKLPNTVLDLYSINGSNNMAVSELELKEQTIPLGLTSTIQKSYSIKVAENTIPAGYEAVLVDKVLNTNTVLSPGTTYDFAIDSTPASQGDARFAINLKTSASLSLEERELDSKIQLWPNPAAQGQFNILNAQNTNDGASTIEISSINGQVIHSQKSNPGTTTTIQTNGWAAGVYILKATNNGTQTTKKLIIQ